MISSKFPKSFRGSGDLVVFYDFLLWFFRVFQTFKNSPSATKSRAPLKSLRKLTWNHLTVFWLDFERNRSSFLFCTVQALVISSKSNLKVGQNRNKSKSLIDFDPKLWANFEVNNGFRALVSEAEGSILISPWQKVHNEEHRLVFRLVFCGCL